MRKILVTGGAGFIGSHVVDALLADGEHVTVLENFDSFYSRAAKERNIAQHRVHPRFRLVECDLRELPAVERSIPGSFDAIVHLAAKAGVRASIADPRAYCEVNVDGTQNLLEFARRRRVPTFVFASSSSVYGVNPRVPWKEGEESLRPISPYAATKLAGELLGHVYSHLHGMRFIGLRLFTVYGPRQRPDLAIHRFAALMLEGRPLPVFGDGSTSRDYTYVDDIVAGIRGALGYDRTLYEIVNLGNDRPVSLREMIAGLEDALGLEASLEHLPEQEGDVPHTLASIEKAHRLFGYAPATSFAAGMRHFAEWFRQCAAGDPAATMAVRQA
jgi:UDP-glucuronate 4-epimerase